MDYFRAHKRQITGITWLLCALCALIPFGVWLACTVVGYGVYLSGGLSVGSALLVSIVIARFITHLQTEPLRALRQAILHVGLESSNEPAPQLDELHVGREMVSGLAIKVYEMASQAHLQSQTPAADTTTIPTAEHVIDAVPLPFFTVDASSNIHSVNEAGLAYLGVDKLKRSEVIGKNINDVLNMSFQNEHTYEAWLEHCRKDVFKETKTWLRVRLTDAAGNPTKQFDLAASYSKGSSDIESALVLFDHTDAYSADDQEISFVALAVHELRTPLTIMRGYIEVFEDELGPTLQPELKDFMHKMNASAQQLTAFVSNILNVARVEENQLVLKLHKEDISEILSKAVDDLELRARVHGKHINLQVATGLPPVAADRISIHEVINNLVDNAIKYGGNSEQINITCQIGQNGLIETSVQDFGVGIPASVMPNLFDKFYRSHRSRVQIGGTGLGLYLCRALVGAHGGNIWVSSHEGQGSTFTFSLEPYDEAKHAAEAGQDGIMRGAHGWIKNHSLYRR